MFLFHLNRFHRFLLAWSLLLGAIGSVHESFAGTLDVAPPFLNFPVSADEEIRDVMTVSIPVPFLRKGQGSGLSVEDRYQDPVFADVYFDDARSSLQGGIEEFLHETVALLKQEDRWALRIEGHCDWRGPSAYNFARADYHLRALAGFLVQLGVPSGRIHSVNFGQTPFSCQSGNERCQEDNLRADRIFSILAVDRFQRGCVARLRLVAGKDSDRAIGYLKRPPYLQRIQLASPQFTSFR